MSGSKLFKYGARELEYLKSRDAELARVIDGIAPPEYRVMPDFFAALAYNIMGQQISMKAVETVWRRALELLGEVTPERVLATPLEELQSVGISMRKASYIRDAAEAIHAGRLDIEALKRLPDEELCAELSKLRGVGKWTAEMLMIFALERPDVLSRNDLGIRRGICILHGLDSLDDAEFEHYRERYSPYGTVASFYLWSVK